MDAIFNQETGNFDVVVNGVVIASSPNKYYAITKAKTALAKQGIQVQQQSVSGPIFEYRENTRSDEEVLAELVDRYETMLDLVDLTATNECKALIVSGPAGLGKSYGVDEVLNKFGDDIRVTRLSGYMRPTGVLKTLWMNRHQDCIIVFDDIDSCYSDEISMNLLKAACDMREKRIITWNTNRPLEDEEGEEIPTSFEFEGSIIIITNADFDRHIDSGSKLAPHFNAMISRSQYLPLKINTTQEYMCWLRYMVLEKNALESSGVTKQQQEMILNWVTEHASRLRELSIRLLLKIAILVKNRENWERSARALMLK